MKSLFIVIAGYEAISLGSLTTGLVSPSSDIDFYIKLPNFNTSDGLYVLQEAEKLFKKQPELYQNLHYFYKVNFTSFQFIHIPSNRKVDLLFEFGEMAVAGSNLLKYYFNLDKRFLPLGQILKFWFQIQRHHGHRRPRDYVLYQFIVFYLQQKNLLPPVYILQKDVDSHYIHEWNVGFNELPFNSTNTEDLHQLLGGFFKFYSEFNYEEYIIAPFAGRPIRKNAFQDIENFPIEYTFYSNDLKDTLQHRIRDELDVSTAVCVQDPFIHSLNEMERLVHREDTETFKRFMKSVATMFGDIPSDRILSAIFAIDQPEETVRRHKHVTADGCSYEEICIDIW